MDYMSMQDWFYGPPEPTWILPTYYPAPPPRGIYEQPAPNYMRMYAKELAEAPPGAAARSGATASYELADEQQLRRMYNVKESSESSPSRSYYHVYPKVQTAATDRGQASLMQRTSHEESRAGSRMQQQVDVDGEGAALNLHAQSKDLQSMKKKESQGTQLLSSAFPFKNLPIELKVPMCCEKCAKKVYNKILDLPGVEDVTTDQYNQKVIVTGNADPSRVLNRVKQVKKHSVFWGQNVEYSQVYLKKQKDREMAMIQAKKQAGSSSSSSSSATAKGSSLKGPLDGLNKGSQHPEHETRTKTSYHESREDGLKDGLNKGSSNARVLLPEASHSQRKMSMYEAREGHHHKGRPNVQGILPESDAMIQRTLGVPYEESESLSRVHTQLPRYQSPPPHKGYRQELYNAPQWEEQYHHHNRQGSTYERPYNPYVMRNN